MWSLISIEFFIIAAIVFGLLGRYIAKQKNRSGAEGFWLGVLFSALGVIIVALLPTKEIDYNLKSIEEQSDEAPVDEFSKEGKLLFYIVALIVIFLVVYGYTNS